MQFDKDNISGGGFGEDGSSGSAAHSADAPGGTDTGDMRRRGLLSRVAGFFDDVRRMVSRTWFSLNHSSSS